MAQIFKSPLEQANSITTPSIRDRWNRWMKYGNRGTNTDYWNNELVELEKEIPFKDETEHDKWSQMLEIYKGDPEFDNMMEEILKRTDSDYSGQDDASKYADQWFSHQIGGYVPRNKK